jgi:hypothetical protein
MKYSLKKWLPSINYIFGLHYEFFLFFALQLVRSELNEMKIG